MTISRGQEAINFISSFGDRFMIKGKVAAVSMEKPFRGGHQALFPFPKETTSSKEVGEFHMQMTVCHTDPVMKIFRGDRPFI